MIRIIVLQRGTTVLAAFLFISAPATAWELGGIQYQRPWPNTMPPSWAGYPLDDQHPGYYGGPRYTEYYNYGYGYGYFRFPSPVPGPLPPPTLSGQPRHPNQPPSLPPGYVPTSEIFKPEPVALLDVEVPADAEVWLEGKKTQQTGPMRKFVSPALVPDKDFEYEIYARWQENGALRTETQNVTIRAGARVRVHFPKPAPAPEKDGPDL